MLTLPAAVIAAVVAGPVAMPPGWPADGDTVRFTTRSGRGSEKGVVVETDADALIVALGSGEKPVRIPLSSLERLEVARGRRHTAREGAVTGGILGALLGAAAMVGLGPVLCEGASNCGPSAEGYLVAMGTTGAVGAGLGALGGLAVKTTRWERVPVVRVQVAARPMPGGAGVQVSLRW